MTNNQFLKIASDIDKLVNTLKNETDCTQDLQMLGIKISHMILDLQTSAINDDEFILTPKIIKTKRMKKSMVRITVAPGVKIDAYAVDDPDDCHEYRGYWCYHNGHDRFYTSINGVSVTGYVTKINSSNTTPVKFIEYDSRLSNKLENFYHSPEIYPESSDKRQITERMVYISGSNNEAHRTKYKYRVGDRDNIADDLNLASSSDLRLTTDIAAHWLMVGFLASHEKKKRNIYN